MYRDAVCTIVILLCPAVARVSEQMTVIDYVTLCVPCLCWCPDKATRPVRERCFFLSRFKCRKVSNAERVNLKDQVNWEASRATSGAAYFCEVRISGGVHQVVVGQVGTWQPAFR